MTMVNVQWMVGVSFFSLTRRAAYVGKKKGVSIVLANTD